MKRLGSLAILTCLFLVRVLHAQPSGTLSSPQPLSAKGVENFYQLSERIFSGSAPEGETAFAELKKRGIKTIISVDGSKPNVEMAKKYGLHYVHLPIGYDGVPAAQGTNLIKAAASSLQPVFIHCHHGLHRGPAGAAVVCMGIEGWTATHATNWMRQAGAASNYAGLYRTVAEFHPPNPAQIKALPVNFAEKVEVSPMVDAMVEIDNRFDNLKLVKKAGYQQPSTHPDVSPAHEALLLQELFQELLRSPEIAKQKPDFKTKLTKTHGLARDFQQLLANKKFTKEQADVAFQKITDSCAACHEAHRN